MKRLALLAALAAAFLSLSAPASAQQPSKVGEIILAANESARGVDFEWPNAYVSLFTDGEQRVVDLTNPTNPFQVSSFNPAFGDQWAEPIVVNGAFISGHRFGGLNLWDVSGAPAQLDTAPTTYHFDGLGVLSVPGQEILLYSESDISPLDAGLRVYDITSGTLNNIGNSLAPNDQRDGRFLMATSDSWVYQLDGGASSTRPLNLNVYDLANPASPLFVQMFNMGNAVGSYGGLTDLEIDPTERILYAACGSDGLRMVDIGNRAAPVVVNTYFGAGYYARELDFLPGTVYMAASARLPSGQWRFLILDCIIPGAPVPVWGWTTWFGDQDYQINDLKLISLATGPVLLIAGKNVNGEATLQVWM